MSLESIDYSRSICSNEKQLKGKPQKLCVWVTVGRRPRLLLRAYSSGAVVQACGISPPLCVFRRGPIVPQESWGELGEGKCTFYPVTTPCVASILQPFNTDSNGTCHRVRIFRGTQRQFSEIYVRKTIWDLEFLEHLFACLRASPRIFEHPKMVNCPFLTDFYPRKVT